MVKKRSNLVLALLPALLALAACDAGGDGAPAAPPAAFAVAAAPVRPSPELGRKLYAAECAGCHGERGRGDGPGAATLPVPPRDFTREPFKFRTTALADPPTRKDVFDTLTHGLPGSGMPSFRFLTEEERRALVEVVFGFAGIARSPEPEPVAIGPETPADPQSIARGRAAFQKHACFACHGDGGRGDGPAAPTLKDGRGRSISPRDFTTGVFRRGESARAIHERIRTGIAGTPMPAHDKVTNEEGWDLARYVLSLAKPAVAPSDPVALGRSVVAQKNCAACHVIEGKGGRVGPSLDVAAGKLRYDWAKRFLANPRPYGKIYPYIPYRMPDLGLTPQEVDGVLALFAEVAGRSYPEPAEPVAKLDPALEGEGKLLYFLRCTECHTMADVIPTPAAKQQGPDLANIRDRLRVDWITRWVADPKAIYPETKMTDPRLTPHEVEAVRTFIWNTSVDQPSRQP